MPSIPSQKKDDSIEPGLKPNGPAAAMVLAAGIGCAVYGMTVVAAVMSPKFKNMMNWYSPAGPLSGKTNVGVIAWLLSLATLYMLWKDREISFKRVWVVTLLLVVLSFLFTFPPVYDAFEPQPFLAAHIFSVAILIVCV